MALSVLTGSFFSALFSIVIIDLILAGDNAVVIAMAVRSLPAEQRKKGIFYGAGDGNIHVNIIIDKSDKAEFGRAEKAVKEIFELIIGLGGTISGEHRIGISKMPYIGMELSHAAIKAMKKIKHVLDPKGILNPGKIFPQIKHGISPTT